MKASKFTDAQKAFILKQGADGHHRQRIAAATGGTGIVRDSERAIVLNATRQLSLSRQLALPLRQFPRSWSRDTAPLIRRN